ncbi:hypothetical protein MYAM1_000680 [Malassezia yamatoensis]|uniref:Peptidase S59 domain-containing protein n=1 Tax=Malassezia yamatoensis TaxID=253288 RepID=A0AAJ6CG80_9BASI|nr:hypothetical protein MYAM1_000680 [Malassezia yamatoensis]
MFGAPSFGGFGQQNQQQTSNPQNTSGTGGLFGQAGSTPSFGGSGAFGQSNPAVGGGTGTGAFGQAQPSSTFGQSTSGTQQSTPFTFGQNNPGSTFGAPKPATGFGAFGGSSTPQQPTQTSLNFGQPSTQPSAFGAQPTPGFGAQPSSGFFGQQANTQQPSTFGGFGGASLGGQTSITQGTATTPYAPYREDATPNEPKAHAKNWDVHQSIASMPAYASMSPEELRLQDYRQGRSKGTGAPNVAGGMPSSGNSFGSNLNSNTTGFGSSTSQPTPSFGQTPSTQPGLFGQSQTQQPGGGLFGSSGSGASTSTPAFGAANTQSSGLFGQNKPANSVFGGAGTSTPMFGQAGQQPGQPAQQGASPFGQNVGQAPSTGFGFGQNSSNPMQAPGSSSFAFGANNSQQQSGGKPSFGGFNTSAQSQQQSTPFSFGSAGNTQAQSSSTPFGATQNNSNSFSFGSNTPNNPTKPGGLFGNSAAGTTSNPSSTPAFGGFGTNTQNNAQQNKPSFSFGGFGANNANSGSTAQNPALGQNANTNNTTQPNQGGLFGAKPAQAAGNTSNFSFGAPSTNQSGSNTFGGNPSFQSGSSLFGAKPAQPNTNTGGLFGQQSTAAQPGQSGSSLFGQPNASTSNTSGGLFGAPAANTTAGTNQAKPSLFNFGNSASSGQNTSQPGATSSLFGQSQSGSNLGSNNTPATGLGASSFGGNTGGLFGQSQPATTGGGLFGASSSTSGAKPLGASAPIPSGMPGFGQSSNTAQASPASLTMNPFGTDALLGNVQANAASQAPLPFHVGARSKPPLVSPFRSSPRNAVRVTRLRGATPGLDMSPRERSAFRESTPLRGSSPGMTPNRSGGTLFRDPSDTQALSPQAFISRSSSKRLVLDNDASFARSPSVLRHDSLPVSTHSRAQFSPAVERSTDLGLSNGMNKSLLRGSSNMNESQSNGAELSVSRDMPRITKTAVQNPSSPPAPKLASTGDYVLSPALHELRDMSYNQLNALHPFSVSRIGFGKVAFLEPVDLATLPDLAFIGGGVVQLRAKECFVYPQEEDLESSYPLDGLKPGYIPVPKAPLGHGLNVPAEVSLEQCWPLDRATREPLTDPSHVRVKQHINKLRNKKNTEFVSYDPESGTWTFIVQHFSRYGLDDSESDQDESAASQDDDHDYVSSDSDDDRESIPAMPLGNDSETTSESSEIHEAQHLSDSKEGNVPSTQPRFTRSMSSMRASATPGIAAGYDSPAPHELPRKVQVMRASFFGNALPQQGQAESASLSPPYEVAYDAQHDTSMDQLEPFDIQEKVQSDMEQAEISVSEQRPIPVKTLPLTSSVMNLGMFANDANLTFGRSFRAGWGPKWNFHCIAPHSSDATIGTVLCKDLKQSDQPESWTKDLLASQLSTSDITIVDQVPFASPKAGTCFRTLALHYASDDLRYQSQFFQLGSALFDPLDANLPQDSSLSLIEEVDRLQRKTAFSNWLAQNVAPVIQSEARAHRAASRRAELIFALLTGHQIEQAAEAAVEAMDFRLATLVAQGGGDSTSQSLLVDQLEVWHKEDVMQFIDAPMRRVYECLAGHVGTDAKVASGLDWRRALGLHLWYGVPKEASLAESVASYADAFTNLATDTQPPLPAFYNQAILGALNLRKLALEPSTERDAMYELLLLYLDKGYPLENVLNARNFGPNALDFTLPWHTMIILTRALQVPVCLQHDIGEQLTLSYAAQIEAQGCWQWSVFLLLHLSDAHVRQAAITAVLERNVAQIDAHQSFLTQLKIPKSWWATAKAVAAHAASDYYSEYKQYLLADKLSEAHHVAVHYLAPETFVRGDTAILLDLFRPFGSAEDQARAEHRPFRVANWNREGRVLLDYASLPHLLPALLAKAANNSITSSERHALQQATDRVHELMESVPLVYPPSKMDLITTVARTEMLVVLNNLARLAAMHSDTAAPRITWTPSQPPEVEQLQAAALDFSSAMLT